MLRIIHLLKTMRYLSLKKIALIGDCSKQMQMTLAFHH